MDRDSLERLLDQGVSIERIAKRFGKHPSTVAYWMAKYGLEAPNRGKHAAKGGLERNHLELLIDEGMTIAEIAEQVGLSKTAVRHWPRRYGLITRGGTRRNAIRDAKAHDRLCITLRCRRHGETEFTLEGSGYYRCKRCRMERV